MSFFSPGSFKKQLQEKIKSQGAQEPEQFVIKNLDPASFSQLPSAYHAQEKNFPQKPDSSSVFPQASPLNKPVHERMKAFVKEQYGGKK